MNVLSINTPKGLYVLTHRRLSLDARSKTLVAGDTVTIDREYTPLCESVPAKSRCAFVTAAAGLAAGREKKGTFTYLLRAVLAPKVLREMSDCVDKSGWFCV